MNDKRKFSEEDRKRIKEIHENFVKKIKSVAIPTDSILNADNPEERRVIQQWATDHETRRRELKAMGAI